MSRELNSRSALVTVVVYMIGSVFVGILAAIYFRTQSIPKGDRIIDGVIDSGMYANILVAIVLALVCLFVFRGSLRDIFFEKRPTKLSKLYLFYPGVLVAIILWGLINVEWTSYTPSVIVLVIIASLAIGFNEEVVTRGILVVGLRNGEVSEWKVFAISTLIFAFLHSINLFGGSNFTQILVTIVSGALFYAARRVSNTLLLPIILHAVYDIAFFLLTGIYVEKSGSLPDHVLDIQFISFLIMLVTTIILIAFGRGLFRTVEKEQAS